MFNHITLTLSEGIAHVRLNRPEKMNTLGLGPGSSRDEIAIALGEADANDEIGCILVTAEGRAFCAGGDLGGTAPSQTPYDEFEFLRHLDDFYTAVRAIKKPIVAGVNGLCLGAGLGLIAQFDLVIAAEDARFGLIEGRIGHPGATEIVPIVGAAWAKYMILTGELLHAQRAADIGLVLTVVPTESLTADVTMLARRIAAVPREAAILNKAAIEAMTDAMGRQAGRLTGRAYDVTTKGQAKNAKAPDGRRFEEIFASEGTVGLKKARDSQFTGSWLPKSP
ncbi:MAG: enoyl-CoA hydratase [Pseudonocardiales bacterium]|nr:enoyl-CoA hydratase [Pseudonocardiales bacterium]